MGSVEMIEELGVNWETACDSSSLSESSKAVMSAADLLREGRGRGAPGHLWGLTHVLWRVEGHVTHGTGEDLPVNTLLQ